MSEVIDMESENEVTSAAASVTGRITSEGEAVQVPVAATPRTAPTTTETPAAENQTASTTTIASTPPRGTNSGRGGSTSIGGRTPASGRGIVNTGGGRNQNYNNSNNGSGRGRGYNNNSNNRQNQQVQQQRPPIPIQIHQQSGVPFGHVPAYLPGTASLVEQLDQRMLIVLRDGKHLIGTLSSFDQFSNLVLFDTIERRIISIPKDKCPASENDDDNDNESDDNNDTIYKYYYTDIPLGIYVVRGDSMVLGGDVLSDSDDDDNMVLSMKKVSIEQLTLLSTNAIQPLIWDFDNDLTA